jgi:hypothetical protein
VARKPLIGTVAANVLEHGTGALNIDGTRIGTDGGTYKASKPFGKSNGVYGEGINGTVEIGHLNSGRWPANVVLDDYTAEIVDEQSGVNVSKVRKPTGRDTRGIPNGNTFVMRLHDSIERGFNDTGGASRFFYCAKAPTRERVKVDGIAHPTVKPLTLMRWLVRLVTPPGGTVLEPFAGSGTTIEAAIQEGFNVVGIEREPDYLPLILARLQRNTEQQMVLDA